MRFWTEGLQQLKTAPGASPVSWELKFTQAHWNWTTGWKHDFCCDVQTVESTRGAQSLLVCIVQTADGGAVFTTTDHSVCRCPLSWAEHVVSYCMHKVCVCDTELHVSCVQALWILCVCSYFSALCWQQNVCVIHSTLVLFTQCKSKGIAQTHTHAGERLIIRFIMLLSLLSFKPGHYPPWYITFSLANDWHHWIRALTLCKWHFLLQE